MIMMEQQSTVIVNADDWGEDAATTSRALDCVLDGVVSSVSAMVFMEDSERAADLARRHSVDAGLHLNLTLPFSAPQSPARLLEHQSRVSRFLRLQRFAPVLYHPGLANSFAYVVKAQYEEYERLYGSFPKRVDGHHHMHLCANVAAGGLLPEGAIVRRNFIFAAGEKSYLNRAYRRWQDRRLARRHPMADLFFDLSPLEPPQRLERIVALGARANVEVEAHPIRDDEYRFLRERGFCRFGNEAKIARGYVLQKFTECGHAERTAQINRSGASAAKIAERSIL